jgi:hypothetical protein
MTKQFFCGNIITIYDLLSRIKYSRSQSEGDKKENTLISDSRLSAKIFSAETK